MPEIRISATSDALSVNGHTWYTAPSTEHLCQAIGVADLVDGDPILYDGKPGKIYRYFDKLGISILEIIPVSRVQRITIFMETPPIKPKRLAPYGKDRGVLRLPETTFSGLLELNGKQLRSPLRFAQFPLKGELTFVHRIAIGNGLSASLCVKSGYVEYIGFDFKEEK